MSDLGGKLCAKCRLSQGGCAGGNGGRGGGGLGGGGRPVARKYAGSAKPEAPSSDPSAVKGLMACKATFG
eukprot:scaffold454627_cov19-Prasinocladus_malaysianus.AAC.1